MEITLPQQTEEYWQAVRSKDRSYEGVFVVAVRSTGIYCRPGCPARQPKRENVTFFATPQDAARAGFRACKRCLPDDVDAHLALAQRVCDYLASADTAPTLAELSEQFHISPFHLQRIFKRVTGISPRQYYDAHRVDQFKTRLKEGNPVTQALYDSGFSSVSQLYPGQLGMTPTEYQNGGVGQYIRYSILPCCLGLLLVATTERGICAVRLSDSEEDLVNQLVTEFPAAQLKRDQDEVSEWVDTILGYLNRHNTGIEDLPVDIQATAFQRRVWEMLRTIPYGSTRSYAQIAQAIGNPKATRAVAQACAANPVPLIIPCHRVVASDGSLGGYSMGVERKRKLLEAEGALPETVQQPTLFDEA